MKKLLSLSFIFALVFAFNSACFAQNAPQAAEGAGVEQSGQVVYEGENFAGNCGPSYDAGCGNGQVYYGDYDCAPRQACMPCYSSCDPCDSYCGPVFRRRARFCAPSCGPVCGPICAPSCGPVCGPICAPSCDPICGPCGYPGTGFYRTPVRNFLSRLFAPRAYCGYDCGPCYSAPCATSCCY